MQKGFQSHFVLGMFLAVVDVKYTSCIWDDKGYTAPYSHVREHWTPIPAEHTMGFSYMCIACHGGVNAPKVTFFVHFFYVSVWRGYFHCESVVPLFDNTMDRKLPHSVHIVHSAEVNAVETDVCYGINAVKVQDSMLALHCGLVCGECSFKIVIIITYLCGDILVFTIIWVWYLL